MKTYKELYMRLARVHGQMMLVDLHNGFPVMAQHHKELRNYYFRLAIRWSGLPSLTDAKAPPVVRRDGVHGYEEIIR